MHQADRQAEVVSSCFGLCSEGMPAPPVLGLHLLTDTISRECACRSPVALSLPNAGTFFLVTSPSLKHWRLFAICDLNYPLPLAALTTGSLLSPSLPGSFSESSLTPGVPLPFGSFLGSHSIHLLQLWLQLPFFQDPRDPRASPVACTSVSPWDTMTSRSPESVDPHCSVHFLAKCASGPPALMPRWLLTQSWEPVLGVCSPSALLCSLFLPCFDTGLCCFHLHLRPQRDDCSNSCFQALSSTIPSTWAPEFSLKNPSSDPELTSLWPQAEAQTLCKPGRVCPISPGTTLSALTKSCWTVRC